MLAVTARREPRGWWRGVSRAVLGRERMAPLSDRPGDQAKHRAEEPPMRLANGDGGTGQNHVKATDWLTAPAAGTRATVRGLRVHELSARACHRWSPLLIAVPSRCLLP